jgi:hypothetical protein
LLYPYFGGYSTIVSTFFELIAQIKKHLSLYDIKPSCSFPKKSVSISRRIMNRKNIIQIIILIALTLTACGAPAADSVEPTSGPDLALTITAQAMLLQAVTQTALAPTSTPEPTRTSTPAFTATPAQIIVTVSVDTNCRSGPGVDYSNEGALTIGQQAEVLGKSSATGYWIIDNPIGAGICWLWGEHATITGDTSGLQEYAVPPTVTALPALAPVIDRVEVRFDSSSGGLIAFLDVYYHDSEGDAILADWQLISTSTAVSGTIRDNQISPSANQRRGGVVTGQWSCGTRVYDVALAVTIHDQAGHASTSVSVVFSCNRN